MHHTYAAIAMLHSFARWTQKGQNKFHEYSHSFLQSITSDDAVHWCTPWVGITWRHKNPLCTIAVCPQQSGRVPWLGRPAPVTQGSLASISAGEPAHTSSPLNHA